MIKDVIPGILSGLKYIITNSGRFLKEIGSRTIGNVRSVSNFIKNIWNGKDAFDNDHPDNEVFINSDFYKKEDVDLVNEAYRKSR